MVTVMDMAMVMAIATILAPIGRQLIILTETTITPLPAHIPATTTRAIIIQATVAGAAAITPTTVLMAAIIPALGAMAIIMAAPLARAATTPARAPIF